MRRPARRGFAILLAAGTAMAAAIATAVVTVGATSAMADPSSDFYTVPAPLPAGQPGDVVKTLASNYTGGTSNVTSTRIMYLSLDAHNQPMAVTGTVLVPNSPWTGSGPRPIVGYAPFTMGMGTQCAVSKTMAGEGSSDIVSAVQNGFVNDVLQKGYAVAETDYQGEGETGGGDPTFVMRLPGGHAVLDAVRAAMRMSGSGLSPSAPVGVEGYSEGGNAAAAAAELAGSYAPDLNIVGVYAGAVPSDLGALAKSLDGSLYAAFLGDALIGINAAYPEANLLGFANQTGLNAFQQMKQDCTLTSIFAFPFTQTSSLTKDGRPVSAYLTQAPFDAIVAENDLGNVAPAVPTMVESAQNDDVIPNSQVVAMAKSWCGKGATVQYNNILSFTPLFSHALASFSAQGDAANYLASRFSGQAAPNNCGQF